MGFFIHGRHARILARFLALNRRTGGGVGGGGGWGVGGGGGWEGGKEKYVRKIQFYRRGKIHVLKNQYNKKPNVLNITYNKNPIY